MIQGRRVVVTSACGVAIAISMIALAIASSSAHAASTRAEYVAQIDPICLGIQNRVDAIRHKVKPNASARELGRAIAKVAKADARGITMIAAIAPPATDKPVVDQWIIGIQGEQRLAKRVAAAYIHIQGKRIRKLTARLLAADKRDDQLIHPLGFQHCDAATPLFP
ncbi:MAG: hypothetical protein ACJ75Z_13740 [Solirubrobacterales bacterium]